MNKKKKIKKNIELLAIAAVVAKVHSRYGKKNSPCCAVESGGAGPGGGVNSRSGRSKESAWRKEEKLDAMSENIYHPGN